MGGRSAHAHTKKLLGGARAFAAFVQRHPSGKEGSRRLEVLPPSARRRGHSHLPDAGAHREERPRGLVDLPNDVEAALSASKLPQDSMLSAEAKGKPLAYYCKKYLQTIYSSHP